MNSTPLDLDSDSQNPYQVDSRKEIVMLMKNLQDKRQLVNMVINDGTEVIVTAIVHVDADSNSMHVRVADVAVNIGGPAPADSYLRGDAIIKAALDSNRYEKAIKVSDDQIASLNLKPHRFHGDWNYTLRVARK